MKIIEKYVSNILWVHQEFCNELLVLQVYFELVLEMHLYFFSNSSIFEVDFQNLCIYWQTQKYNWSRLSKLTNLHSNLEKYLKYTF